MLRRFWLWVAVLWGVLVTWAPAAEAPAKKSQPTSDIRVLIDVSGSMKKNDPLNLRVPALQLLTNLLPKGSKAGIWLFAEKVNMLVPWHEVDKNWQGKAEAAARQIHSRGLFTDIGSALEAASFGWDKPDLHTKRSIILLTDGMVDISKDPKQNELARRKLLDELLPRLKATGAAIHTIALSKEADSELLGRVSGATDGWFQSAEKSEDLQRIFLKIFEQATARDSLPLDNNRFKVDSAIEEFTLLVFRKPESAPTELVPPDGKAFDAEHAPGNVKWHRDTAYDLVTIEKPTPGDWQLKASIDPDNRLMVVSNLSLRTPEIPNNLLAGESITYAASLVEDGEIIKRKDFLDLVSFSLHENRDGKASELPLVDDGSGADSVKGDGRYSAEIVAGTEEGTINLELLAKSATFERKRQHAIHVYGAPFEHQLKLAAAGETAHTVILTPKDSVVDPESLQLHPTVTFPDGSTKEMALTPGQGNQLLLSLPVVPGGGQYRIQIQSEGRTATGRAFKLDSAPIVLVTDPLPGHEAVKPEPKAEEKKPEPAATVPEQAVEPAKPEKKNVNWTLWIGLGLAVNVVLIGVGLVIARILKKRRLAAAAELAGGLGE